MGAENEQPAWMIEAERHERERRFEHELLEVGAEVRSQLIEAAVDELKNGHLDSVIITDASGHEYRHTISREEAAGIDRAMWSAGEDTVVDRLVGGIVEGLRHSTLDLDVSDHLQLNVRWAQD